MRKEIIIAITVGFVIGLIITFGIYTANRALKQKSQPAAELPSVEAPSAPTPPPALLLEITEPENNLVVNKNKITVSGKADAKTTIAILAEDFEDLLLTDEEGVFSSEVPLTGGANEIKIIAINKSGEKEEKVITIVYTTAKIE